MRLSCARPQAVTILLRYFRDAHRYNPFGQLAYEIPGTFFPVDPPQFYKVPFSYHQIDPIEESLIGAGFTDINVAVVSLKKEIPDAARASRGGWSTAIR